MRKTVDKPKNKSIIVIVNDDNVAISDDAEAKLKKYTVMIIGDSDKYETIAKNVNGTLAGAIAKRLIANGTWTQVKEEK